MKRFGKAVPLGWGFTRCLSRLCSLLLSEGRIPQVHVSYCFPCVWCCLLFPLAQLTQLAENEPSKSVNSFMSVEWAELGGIRRLPEPAWLWTGTGSTQQGRGEGGNLFQQQRDARLAQLACETMLLHTVTQPFSRCEDALWYGIHFGD